MAHYVIDLRGDEDVIAIAPEEDPKELAKREEARKKALEEIFRRAPRPQLQIIE